jgi:hypothetical protein
MTFNWDINALGILAIIAQFVALVIFWVRTSDRATQAEKKADEARTSITLLGAAFAAYREQVAREYISREMLRDFEARVGDGFRDIKKLIESLSGRIDKALVEK